jgi:CheY-like chemotaxis protein
MAKENRSAMENVSISNLPTAALRAIGKGRCGPAPERTEVTPGLNAMSAREQQISGAARTDEILVYVVDDEVMIGDVVQMILRSAGYKAKYFEDPAQAWAAFVREQSKPALLLTDYRMAPINGMELIERCKQAHPELKTILYSGNASEQVIQQSSAKPDAFLRKPFLPRTLLNLLRSTLNPSEAKG